MTWEGSTRKGWGYWVRHAFVAFIAGIPSYFVAKGVETGGIMAITKDIFHFLITHMPIFVGVVIGIGAGIFSWLTQRKIDGGIRESDQAIVNLIGSMELTEKNRVLYAGTSQNPNPIGGPRALRALNQLETAIQKRNPDLLPYPSANPSIRLLYGRD